MDFEIVEEYATTEDEERKEYLLSIIIIYFMELYDIAEKRFSSEYDVDLTEYEDSLQFEYFQYLYYLLVDFRERALEKKKELEQRERFERDRGTYEEPEIDPFDWFLFEAWAVIERSETDNSQQQAQYGVVLELQRQHPEYEIFKQWIAYPGCCNICLELSRRPPIPLNEPFLVSGNQVDLPDGKVFIYDYVDRFVAVAHPNDRCSIDYIIRR